MILKLKLSKGNRKTPADVEAAVSKIFPDVRLFYKYMEIT